MYLVLEIGQVLRKNVSKWWIGGFGSHGDHVAKAYEYGWRLAQVLKKKGQTRSNLIWGLGQDTHPERGKRVGDKNAANSARNYKELVKSMAEGLADATNGLPMNSRDSRADYSSTMMSFHVGATGPKGGPSGDPSSSSEWFHKDDWLDYNAHQSGRHDRYIAAVHQLMSADYNRSPTKPALESEVSYENQVIKGESGKQRYTAYHSRLHAYWAVFSGGAGHQYGNNNVWQFYDPSRFTPRGEATYGGQLGASGIQNFDPPGSPSGSKASEGNDWVLVLDDASRDFPAPGSGPPIIVDPTNQPPVASAGSDQTVTVPAIVSLQGEVDDDGLPSGTLNTEWNLVSGPGEVIFSDATAAKTTVSFSDQGRYVLRLSASDGALSSSDEVIITVTDESDIPFGTPANLKAVRVSSNQIDLQWDDVTGETSYLLIARSGGAKVLRIRLDANTNGFSHFKLSPETTYTYKVRADRSTDEGGKSDWSDLLRVTTTEGKDVPPPPVNDAQIAFIMAHRGGTAEAPENTLAAFEHALRLGVNIEMDVHLTSDGVIVVIHKEKVDYTTNGKGYVRNMTLKQIKRLDAGSHFSRKYKDERIPTLEEVFDLFIAEAPDNVIMSIDTHAESASIYDPLIELLQRYDLFERAFIEVTDTRVGDALRLRDNRVQLAVWAPSNREIDAAIDYPYYQRIHTRSRYAGRVEDVHNADKTLIAFVNSDGDIKTIRNFDIDGINTDRPEQMLSKFDN